MGGADEEVADDVVLLQVRPAHALAAAALRLVGVDLGALGVAGRRDGHDDVLAGDEVFLGDVADGADDLGAAVVAELLHDLCELVADDVALALRAGQDVLEVGDLVLQLGELVDDLLALEGGQAAQLHGQDGVGLHLVDVEQAHQAGARGVDGRRPADQGDDLVERIQRLDQAAEDVGALFGLVQAVLGAADDDFDLVVDVEPDHLVDAQGARHAVDDGQHVGAEAGLQLRVLVQVVQHHARHGVALELDDDAHAPLEVGLVVDGGDAGQAAVADLLGDVGDEAVRVDLVRQFGDDDLLPGALLLDGGDAAHADRAAAGGVGLLDALVADDLAGGREVGALDEAHDRLEGGLVVGLRVVQAPVDGRADFAQVVRRDVGGHADGDAAGTVHQQLGDARRQDDGLGGAAVVVGLEVDGVLADVADHLHGQRREAGLGVSHGRRAVVAAGTEVALAVDERVAHGPRLGHADHGVVDRGVAVRVVVAHGVRDGLGGLHVATFGAVAVVVHGVEDAAVDGLQAVAHLRQGSAHDDGHRVVDVARLHFLVDVDGVDLVPAIAAAAEQGAVVVAHSYLHLVPGWDARASLPRLDSAPSVPPRFSPTSASPPSPARR